MRHAVLAVLGLGFGAVAGLGVGCEGENKLPVVVEEGPNAIRPNLPPVPTLPPPPYPVHHPAFPGQPGSDGQYSIYGVRHEAARNWSKTVTVRGHIVEVYTPIVPGSRPPRLCTDRDRCLETRPHIFIADSPTEADPANRMQVTGYANTQQEISDAQFAAAHPHPPPAPRPGQPPAPPPEGPTIPVDFFVGAQVAVTGTFTRRAPNGQADSEGLIQYTRHVTLVPAADAGAPPPPPHH